MAALDYESAVAALERALRFGINPTLERVGALCDALGRPQAAFDCIQVAGTNGKTSTARLLAAAARSQGRRDGVERETRPADKKRAAVADRPGSNRSRSRRRD